MRLPRDLDGDSLANAMKRYGYAVTRQLGSHMRLTTQVNGEHHVTVPRHDPLKVGTLSGILQDVALHQGKSRDQVILELFS